MTTRRFAESQLLAGYIYGDNDSEEYIYVPASEIGTETPMAVYEHDGTRDDLSLEKALYFIERRNLRLVTHPLLGKRVI
jgi:hypothetical protein